MAKKRYTLTLEQHNALATIENMAEENSCSCVDENDGKGWNGHDSGCWVGRHSEDFEIVNRILNERRK